MSAAEAGSFLRRAGTGTLADGTVVTWSVAEGARGRRWRWTLAANDVLRHVGLIELDAEGRFERLELETLTGMLTLHPDGDGRWAHGNVVRDGGVEPVAIAWSSADALGIEGDAFGSAVAGWQGRGWVLGTDLRLRRGDGAGDSVNASDLDARGVPRLRNAGEFPLEA